MVTPENDPSPNQSEQPSFEFDKYIARNMQSISDEDVNPGDVILFTTKSGSTYILEVEAYQSGFLSGQLSRRGQQVKLAQNSVLGSLEAVPAKVYVDYDFLSVGRQSLVTPQHSEGFQTSLVTNLMLVNFEPFDTKS